MAKKTMPTHSGERKIHLDLLNSAHHGRLQQLGRALASRDRLRVLNLLSLRSMSVVEVATRLSLPVSSVAHHFSSLEEAGLIITESQPGLRGSMRIGLCSVQDIHLLAQKEDSFQKANVITVDMPIGNYFDCEIAPTCGLAGLEGMLGLYDSPKAFYSPLRSQAQLLWFQHGYLDYRFPNYCSPEILPREIAFSLELCSEAVGFQEQWPSDITFSINGRKLGTYTSRGDYGSRRGLLTPSYWPTGSTQYGCLVTVSVKEQGFYLNQQLVHDQINMADLQLLEGTYIQFGISIDPKANHVGGINIFGEKFGDHPQNIQMRLHY